MSLYTSDVTVHACQGIQRAQLCCLKESAPKLGPLLFPEIVHWQNLGRSKCPRKPQHQGFWTNDQTMLTAKHCIFIRRSYDTPNFFFPKEVAQNTATEKRMQLLTENLNRHFSSWSPYFPQING